jgi:hypothetical protein
MPVADQGYAWMFWTWVFLRCGDKVRDCDCDYRVSVLEYAHHHAYIICPPPWDAEHLGPD